MTFAAPPIERLGRTIAFTAANASGVDGFDDGGSGLGIFGTPSDAKPIYWRGARIQGFWSEPGSLPPALHLFVRTAGVPAGEQSWASLAALNADRFFTRLNLRTAAGALLVSLDRASAIFTTAAVVHAEFYWFPSGGMMTAGQPYLLELV